MSKTKLTKEQQKAILNTELERLVQDGLLKVVGVNNGEPVYYPTQKIHAKIIQQRLKSALGG